MENYIKKYCDGFDFWRIGTLKKSISGIEIVIDIYESWKEIHDTMNYREKAHITMKKGELSYECVLYDENNYGHPFFNVTIKEKPCFLFRKTLYGFTLLDLDTLTEVYEYVPLNVKNRKESFIISDVKQLGKLLVFDGCYWAAPYECYVYDYDKKLFANVSTALGITSLEKTEIKEDMLYLSGDVSDGDNKCKNVRKQISLPELNRLIEENGVEEI